ncbi:DUF2807 domain-containing protein [Sphingomonas crocodyli]|uniref:DUF2807 domain-containing protein n=2 Tax=Sphingomonas crocodyli TaxID=1979270 RepID=A0A437MBT3_9SPHN|nr:DUF2807 domain-containing protein [Sphingomonas crocodyli]
MSRRPLIAFTAAACALAAACSANAATRPFPVPGFSKLRVEGPYTVRVHTGAKPSVVARGPQDRIDKLIVETRGEMLVITTEKSWGWKGMSWGKNDTVYVDVTVPTLSAAELTGSGDVDVDVVRAPAFAASVTGSGNLTVAQVQTETLTSSVTGSGDLTVNGKAETMTARVTGSGDLHAGGVNVGTLTATVTGSGDIAVGPTRVANASVTGSGDIDIAGRPQCKTAKRGSGEVRCGG